MTARRTLRSAAAIVVVAATVLLLGVAPTPAPIPDDPADPVRASEYWLDGARIREAWQTTRGKGVTIAVIDTGIGKVPSVFGDAVVGGTDVSGSGTPDGRTPLGAVDGNHGSWVASLAAGRGAPDGTGMIGVAPEANLLSISVGFSAAAAVPFTEQVAKGMRWAVDNGADIINLSFTTNTLDWDKSWDDAFLYAFEHDVVVVVAAGNRGSGTNIIGAPATIPGVLTVGWRRPDRHGEHRGVDPGHHDRDLRAQRGAHRRLRRRHGRAVARNQWCGAHRRGSRSADPLGAPRHQGDRRHQPHHQDRDPRP